jgi:dTDP-4-amino-4,6-dideoxygalactose transaminase
VGCFSFFSNINLSTEEGGMLVSDRDDIAQKARSLRSYGMTSMTWDRHLGHAYSYDVGELGYNYRLDEIRSALGLVQLEKLEENNARRKNITEKYWESLSQTGLWMPFQEWSKSPAVNPAYHIFPALLPDTTKRKEFMESLQAEGVQTSIHYPPIHRFTYHQNRYPNVQLPKTEQVASRTVTLPLYPTMNDQAFETVIRAIQRHINGN